MAEYARCILGHKAMVQMVPDMWSPKNAFRQIPELISLRQLKYRSMFTQLHPDFYFSRLCTCNGFHRKWKERFNPLDLNPRTCTTHHRATSAVWPRHYWIS